MADDDKGIIRAVRKEFVRHPINVSEAQISISRGIVRLNGRVAALSGHEDKFDDSMIALYKALKSRPEIRDIMFDWQTPGRRGINVTPS